MALPQALNFYTHAQLNSYTHNTLAGTIHFEVRTTVTYSRDVIGKLATVNVCNVKFSSTAKIDAWECRATLEGSAYGVGIGLLVGSGGAVTANTETSFDITYSQLTFGDGKYRITVYVQLDGVWYGG